MKQLNIVAAICAAFSGTALMADFSYDQTTQMTGGFLMKMPAIMGGNKMREPQRSTVIVKGNRMAHIYADHTSVTDLDKETITEIHFKDKTYTVMTFEEMRQMMASMQGKKRDANTPETEFQVEIKKTGQSKVIAGMNAEETLMTFKMKSSDPRSGKEATMNMLNDMWLVKKISGYEEVLAFGRRMGEKMSYAMQGGGMPMAGPAAGMGQAMAAAMKNAEKMEGVPVLYVIRMKPEGEQFDTAMTQSNDAQKQAAAQQQQQPAPQQNAEQSAASALAGRFGRGLAGGLGGLRKKKNDQQDAPPAQQTPAATSTPNAAGDNSLMETTIESSGFSNAPVDASKFEVPAGFKQVQRRTGR